MMMTAESMKSNDKDGSTFAMIAARFEAKIGMDLD